MLELLAQKHNLWLNMVMSFGCDYQTAQDLVQSMYLRMHKYVKEKDRIMYNDDEVNRFFVYVTLKNMYKSYKTSSNKYQFFELREEDEESNDKLIEDESFSIEMDAAFERIVARVSSEMNTWHRYDKILSEKYFKSDYSLRDIAIGSGISLTSIFNTIKTNKKILKKKFKEDWEDFKNGDYHKI